MATSSVDAARRQAQEELIEAVEAAVQWLQDRARHLPPEMRDPRESGHRRALRTALAEARS